MTKLEDKMELTSTMLEVGRKIFPRRYRRFEDLRPSQEASEWARSLDWRQNPYDRFLLRREILRRLESTVVYDGPLNVYGFASREEIAAEVDHLLNEYPDDPDEGFNVLTHVLVALPWCLVFKHTRVEHNRLEEVLASLPSKETTLEVP